MKRARFTIPLSILAMSLAPTACEQPTTGASGFTELHRAAVPDVRDLEVVMGLIDRPGESSSAKHYHPSGEFGFILEGTVTVATEGDPNVLLKAGDSFYLPSGDWHIVGTTTGGAKTLVFRVMRKGQPAIIEID